MKVPSGDLLFYAAVLLGGAIYLIIRLPTIASEHHAVAVALIVCVMAEAVLLLVRFRWSPELFVAITLFFLGWGVVQGVADGFSRTRIGMTTGAVVALFAYPVLRREIRGPVVPGPPVRCRHTSAEQGDAH